MRARLVPALLCCGALAAGEAPALFRMEAGDLAATRTRYEQSVYAKLWNLPSLAPMRAKAEEGLKEGSGPEILALLQAMTKASLVVEDLQPGATPDQPKAVSLGTLVVPGKAQQFAKSFATAQSLTAAGANTWAMPDGQSTLTANADQLVATAGKPTVKPFVLTSKADMAMTWDGPAQAKSILAMAAAQPDADPALLAQLKRVLADLPSGTGQATLTPNGTRVEAEIAGASKGLIAVDAGLLAALPANTLAVWSVGLDMGPLWERYGKEIIEAQAREQGSTPQEVAQQFDQMLAGMGVEGGTAAAAKATKGTVGVAILPGVPFPTLSVMLPRGPLTDALLAMAAAQAGVQPPAVGATVQKPAQPGGGMQIPTFFGRTATYNLISTDPVFAGAFAKGSSSGFAKGNAGLALQGKPTAGACFVSASDTPALMLALQAPLGMAMMAVPPEGQEALGSVLQSLPEIAKTIKPGYSLARVQGATTKVESEGVFSLLSLPIGAGMVAGVLSRPSVPQQRPAGAQPAPGGVQPKKKP